MPPETRFIDAGLAGQGLNLQAVFRLDVLPVALADQLQRLTPRYEWYTQMVLLGHGGRLLWQKVQQAGLVGDNPVDDYSRRVTTDYFEQHHAPGDFELVFPVDNQPVISLQSLGALAGWHHDTPMRIGINPRWGSWFAYRAAVLVKGDYPVTLYPDERSPCLDCDSVECVGACPVMTRENPQLDIMQCVAERSRGDSGCKDRCLARLACPVADEHRYTLAQLRYHYLKSLGVIESMNR